MAGKGLILPRGGNHVVFLELRRDSRVTKGNSGFLLCWPSEVQSSFRVARDSWGVLSSYCRAKRPHLALCSGPNDPLQGRQGSRVCITDSPMELGLVLSEEGNPAGLSSCSGGLRPLVELCMVPAGLCGRGTGVAVPLRVVPSPTGLTSKRGPGLGSFSRADRGIGGVRHVAPPTWLVSNFLVRPASS